MNKVKIFENKNIIIYKKGEFMIGDEAEIANNVFSGSNDGIYHICWTSQRTDEVFGTE